MTIDNTYILNRIISYLQNKENRIPSQEEIDIYEQYILDDGHVNVKGKWFYGKDKNWKPFTPEKRKPGPKTEKDKQLASVTVDIRKVEYESGNRVHVKDMQQALAFCTTTWEDVNTAYFASLIDLDKNQIEYNDCVIYW